jgi:hypothetical protein
LLRSWPHGIVGAAPRQEDSNMSSPVTISTSTTDQLLERLREANREVAARYPLETGKRQPVHTVYGGAHLLKSDAAGKLEAIALRMLEEYGPDPVGFTRAIWLEVAPEPTSPRIRRGTADVRG